MKSTGIVRKVDELGRIVIPMELRKVFGIEVKDPLEIYVEEDRIILSKYQPVCVFCGDPQGVIEFKNKSVCRLCSEMIADNSDSDSSAD